MENVNLNVGSFNAVSNASSGVERTAPKESEAVTKKDVAIDEKKAAVYEPSKEDKTDSAKKTYKQDNAALIEQMKADLAKRQKDFENLVMKTLNGQKVTFDISNANDGTSIFDAMRDKNFTASAEDIAKAKEDISEDGYWGVKQTSERLYSFAYALADGDPDKADMMLSAIEKGFKQAEKAFGSELPDITKQTLEATREKINAWKNGTVAETEALNTEQ
ncbi:MAG: hypothetical protein K6G65_06340 [Lachnospiraceae bacterium]|nr:hypothetical protein [Lachnospiraceae bacterium]